MFSNLALNEGLRKICIFQQKIGHISEMVIDSA